MDRNPLFPGKLLSDVIPKQHRYVYAVLFLEYFSLKAGLIWFKQPYNGIAVVLFLLDWGVNQQPASPPGSVQQQLLYRKYRQLWNRKPTHEEKGDQQVSGKCQEGPAKMGAVYLSQVCPFLTKHYEATSSWAWNAFL